MPTVIGSAQITLIDLTDAYGVMLTSEAHTFPGSTSAALAGSVTTQVVAMRGAEQVPCSVVLGEVVKPAGVTVTKDTDATSPTLAIALSTAVTAGGVVKIPVHIGDLTIHKEFSFAIAFKGTNGTSVTITKSETTYQASTSGTAAPAGSWAASPPAVAAGSYLWTRTVVSYSDGKTSTAYSVARQGADGSDGTSVKVSSQAVTYAKSSSGTAAPSSGWTASPPATSPGDYLWTKTVVSYSDGKSTTSYSVSRNGTDGAPGADAVTIDITSSNGTVFKNTSISTVLTAHVYKGGVELTAAQISALGTVKWYKDGSSTASATGQTLTIDAGAVSSKADYVARLEK